MFDAKAQEKLGFYVYALFDPRDSLVPFYVGKGSGNRVFAHARGAKFVEDFEDEPLGPKLRLIKEIQENGQEVVHKSRALRSFRGRGVQG